MTSRVVLTVAVLVHNGESVIEETLRHIAEQRTLDRVEILAICNGCVDRSIDVVRRASRYFSKDNVSYKIVVLPPVGRGGALNFARRVCKGGLVVVDQDATLSPNALSAINEAFVRGYCFATLRPRVTRSRSHFVNAYYRFWQKLHYVKHSPASNGLYALSERAIHRVATFPRVHSDDKFVRLQFAPYERTRIDSEWYQVTSQQDLLSLLRDRARYNRGNHEIRKKFASQLRNDVPRNFLKEVSVIWDNITDGALFATVIILSATYAYFSDDDLLNRKFDR